MADGSFVPADCSNLLRVIADIREKSGVGAKPMLDELADAIAAEIGSVPAARPTHRHKKRGTEYVLIGIGKMQAEGWHDAAAVVDAIVNANPMPSVDMREVAIYRSVDDGSLWVRPREEFEDGRFEPITATGGQ